MFHVRFQLSEMPHSEVDTSGPTESDIQQPQCLPQIADSRAECQASRETNRYRTSVSKISGRRVHSEAQLGNALTKGGAKELGHFYKLGGLWRIVHDPQMRSARKRRQDGSAPYDQQVPSSRVLMPQFEQEGSPWHAGESLLSS